MNISQEAQDAANDIQNMYTADALQDPGNIARRIQMAIDKAVTGLTPVPAPVKKTRATKAK